MGGDVTDSRGRRSPIPVGGGYRSPLGEVTDPRAEEMITELYDMSWQKLPKIMKNDTQRIPGVISGGPGHQPGAQARAKGPQIHENL